MRAQTLNTSSILARDPGLSIFENLIITSDLLHTYNSTMVVTDNIMNPTITIIAMTIAATLAPPTGR